MRPARGSSDVTSVKTNFKGPASAFFCRRGACRVPGAEYATQRVVRERWHRSLRDGWASGPIFYLYGRNMDGIHDKLTAMAEPAVTSLGYELVGLEYRPNKSEGLLRIYIDSAAGVTLEDCELVSHQISGLLDVEDPIQGAYRLEISSPGLDRPLFKAADFERFAGVEARIRLTGLWDGRRKFRGILRGVQDGHVLIEEEGAEYAVPLDRIDRANLVPDV